MKQFRPAKKRIEVSVGESVRIVRELQELSQNQLAELTGIPQATISATAFVLAAVVSTALPAVGSAAPVAAASDPAGTRATRDSDRNRATGGIRPDRPPIVSGA